MISAQNFPAVIAGRYQPVRLIAKGGMGAVYEVEHARTGERLALKVLLSGVGASAENLERFKREARASARIKSEHVVRVIDADVAPELDGAPFLVMELLDGMDLERKAAAALPDPATVVDWLRQVAIAIDKAHRLGIIHRDLKPENLFLTTVEDRPPFVKVLDFGIIKMAEDGTGATGSGQIIGTPRYMAPEQASSSERVTPATDLFALGLVAYRLLTGESYFKGDPINVLAQLLYEPMRPLSEKHPQFGKAIDAWFSRACHRDPTQRFSSAAEQVESLSAALGLPTIAISANAIRRPSGPVATTHRVGRRPARPLIGLAVGAVLVGGAIAGVLLLRGSPPAQTAVAAPPVAPAAIPKAAPAAANLVDTRPAPPVMPPPAAAPIMAPGPAPAATPAKKRPAAIRAPVIPPSPTPGTERPPAHDPYADQK